MSLQYDMISIHYAFFLVTRQLQTMHQMIAITRRAGHTVSRGRHQAKTPPDTAGFDIVKHCHMKPLVAARAKVDVTNFSLKHYHSIIGEALLG